MALKILTPLYINNDSDASIYPNVESVSNTDRMFIVSDNIELAETLITCINEQLVSHRSVSTTNLINFVDEITTSNNRLSSASLALAFLNRNGCLVMQMGKSRILHISPTTGEIEYDSSNHILDTLSSKAKTQQLTKINTNDTIIITLTDRVDSQRVLRLMCDNPDGDDNAITQRLTTLLGKHREEAPATYALRFASASGVGGNAKSIIKDINWKWVTLFLALAALIAAISVLSLNTNIFHWNDDNVEVADTVATESDDTTRILNPAIDDIPSYNETDNKQVADTTIRQHDASHHENASKQNEEPATTSGTLPPKEEPVSAIESSTKKPEPKAEPSVEPQPSLEPTIAPEE